jgi:hypothetical protein
MYLTLQDVLDEDGNFDIVKAKATGVSKRWLG